MKCKCEEELTSSGKDIQVCEACGRIYVYKNGFWSQETHFSDIKEEEESKHNITSRISDEAEIIDLNKYREEKKCH